ncbi:SSS family solute:Na+ symporter [Streptomyces africanus]|uniref:SSS family solute:Na+ symporter n=1 Tax=Streptomyces africanus TaxID=231024 RepID=A0ABU0QMQ7_9ACTN|nr:sodium:solute symporter family protein [Streptomyces africanus]MDQ0748255.1 SSS family solute:Na+ symporter [Streptomyces africanus]
MSDRATQLSAFVLVLVLISVLGFSAVRWRRAGELSSLDEWGLGGRRFGTWTTWFLIGGDLYTAYTFVAVPAIVFGSGALGFFALPYTVILYPLVYLTVVRLWSVSRALGLVTPADFVRVRYGSRALACLVAVTGLAATVPYLALQLAGISSVLSTMGITGHGAITVAFAVVAAYTYRSGMRAPAVIAIVKDVLITGLVIVSLLWIPSRLGGWDHVFDTARAGFAASPQSSDGILLHGDDHLQYVTLALGSALALFLYPHMTTSLLAAADRNTVKRTLAALPAYSLLLGLIALFGYLALAAGVTPLPDASGQPDPTTVVPLLFQGMFPPWLAGIAFAALGIAALVPAAVMSIAAGNLVTRNLYREYVNPLATDAQEARVSKVASLFSKAGALALVVVADPQLSVGLQLAGGVLVLQTLPAIALGLYTRWFHRFGLVAGLVAGLAAGLVMLYLIDDPAHGRAHFAASAFPLADLGLPTGATVYAGLLALIVNLVVAGLVTALLRARGVPDGPDITSPDDYLSDPGRRMGVRGPRSDTDPPVGSRKSV